MPITAEPIVMQVGALWGYGSLHQFLAPALTKLRHAYLNGSRPHIILDLTSATFGSAVSIAALAALLSVSKKISESINRPIEIKFKWDPVFLGFLSDIEFFKISKRFNIFEWQEEMVGGFQSGSTNPNTKLIYFADVQDCEHISSDEQYEELRRSLVEKILPNFVLRTERLFAGLDPKLRSLLNNTVVELIVNSLTHGQDQAFVALQHSGPRISVAVCDSGSGFLHTVSKKHKILTGEHQNIRALIVGSLVRNSRRGIRRIIDEIVGVNNPILPPDKCTGWVTLSSNDSMIRWERDSWRRASAIFSEDLIPAVNVSGSQLVRNIGMDLVLNKTSSKKLQIFPDSLKGSRIAFEIKLH